MKNKPNLRNLSYYLLASALAFSSSPSQTNSNQLPSRQNSQLENITNDTPNPPYEIWSPQPERDYDSGAEIVYAPPHEMGPNVLGKYDPSQHRIYIRTNLSSREEAFAIKHESNHWFGLNDELKNDIQTANRIGYFLRNWVTKN